MRYILTHLVLEQYIYTPLANPTKNDYNDVGRLMSKVFILQRFTVPRWNLRSVDLSPRIPALMIVQTSDVILSVHMAVCLDTIWQGEASIWFVRLTECGKDPFHTVNVSVTCFISA